MRSKKTSILLIASVLLLGACASPTSTPTSTPEIVAVTAAATNTSQPTTTATAPATATKILATPTVDLASLPSHTPQPPAICPQVDTKLRIFLGEVFKNKKAAYHDARQVVLDFLNQGGDPEWAIKKLNENGVTVTQMDITHDGIKEFFLPSGYYTIFGCQDGKYVTLLDIAPTEYTEMAAVPLVIQDLNLNGIPELFIGQAQYSDQASYRILEWDGAKLVNVVPAEFEKNNTKIYIDKQIVYTIGQSNAQKGALVGNYEIVDTDGNGLKDVVIHAGVYNNFLDSSSLQDTIILKWNGKSYVIGDVSKEATSTPEPTFTPLPFSATCSNIVPALRYENFKGYVYEAVAEYLNQGGDPKQLKSYYSTTIQDLNNDTVPEVLIINPDYPAYIYLFSCQNGKYVEIKEIETELSNSISLLGIYDNNKNGFAEVFVKEISCFSDRCGSLNVIEWNGKKFAQKIKEIGRGGKVSFSTSMDEPSDAYLKDLDNDGIKELVWTGEVTPDWHGDHWAFYPQRLATHVFKWDGTNYSALPVEYAAPEYRFQAVQDGDLYSEAGLYEKALKSYQLAIKSDGLGWWTEERWNYIVGPHGLGPCADDPSSCPPPEPNPDERPTLSAYASFKMVAVHLLMNNPTEAEAVYQKLLTDYPENSPAYPVTKMATAFWDEYQESENISGACSKAVSSIAQEEDTLALLSGGGIQGTNYTLKTSKLCPFK
ncbi:MAG: hypothetical protein CVU44_05095 [Chloroflexi bacterium HGW-Chloroflexi-6]|nr:MAG: hypothetical protein CVU44_05095 [Chloroflexi bacterium HGW-Chloroflexi-6]